jgi:protein YIPF1/2
MSLKVLRPYFDVPTKTILTRLGLSFVPFNKKFVTNYTQKPDLYGPFWVLTTLIATLFISSNMYCYMTWPEEKGEALSVSFKTIPIAASIIYGFGIGLPLGFRLLLNLYGTQPPQGQE